MEYWSYLPLQKVKVLLFRFYSTQYTHYTTLVLIFQHTDNLFIHSLLCYCLGIFNCPLVQVCQGQLLVLRGSKDFNES